jgi:hypothetical protein
MRGSKDRLLKKWSIGLFIRLQYCTNFICCVRLYEKMATDEFDDEVGTNIVF